VGHAGVVLHCNTLRLRKRHCVVPKNQGCSVYNWDHEMAVKMEVLHSYASVVITVWPLAEKCYMVCTI